MNVGLKAGESIIVSTAPMEDATRVLLLPFASSLSGFDGDVFEDGLKPFLLDNDRPLSVGDLVETPCGEGEVCWSGTKPGAEAFSLTHRCRITRRCWARPRARTRK